MAKNRVIGIDNKLPWHLPADLAHFKSLTLHKTIIMGRKTWESLPGLLSHRRHIVITREKHYQAESAEVAHSLEAALELTKGDDEVFIVGGGQLYEQALAFCDRLHITHVDVEIKGDTFFPTFNLDDWILIESSRQEADEKNKYALTYETWDRAK